MTNNWIFFILIFTILSACKKDKGPQIINWPEGAGDFAVYTVAYNTYVIKEDGSLWARGAGFSYASEATKDGYMKIDDDVNRIAVQQNSFQILKMYILKKDNSVWQREFRTSSDFKSIISQSAPVKIMDDVISIKAGMDFGLFLKKDNTAWAMGQNQYGQFGLGNISSAVLPLTKIADGVTQIEAGGNTIYLIKRDHSLWAAGSNSYGSLGYDTPDNQPSPNFTKIFDDIAFVRAVWSNVMLVKANGTAWSFGSNVNGTQGIGVKSQNYSAPHQVAEDVREVFPHATASYLIKNDGSLWACGSNLNGLMGKPDPLEALNYIKIADQSINMSIYGNSSHMVFQQGDNYLMSGRNNYRQVSQSEQVEITVFSPFKMP